ncbi:unnamed protein product [Ilex paraguariensis]|uniref:Uncharacterized protein n=1 Tax=Ilex paraguariensis TaxID=185542 RepID=A0ABC8RQQ8_9AQUA
MGCFSITWISSLAACPGVMGWEWKVSGMGAVPKRVGEEREKHVPGSVVGWAVTLLVVDEQRHKEMRGGSGEKERGELSLVSQLGVTLFLYHPINLQIIKG